MTVPASNRWRPLGGNLNIEPVDIDTARAHPARVYNFLLDGTDHFAVDREAAERGAAALPGGIDHARAIVRSERGFRTRAVRYLAEHARITQFLDIGTGIPDGAHSVAQQVAPEARIVYVDEDPLVLAHGHVLRQSTTDGATDVVWADLRDPDAILSQAAATLDFERPIGLVLVGVPHLLGDRDDPWRIVARLVDAVPIGSYVLISHWASDLQPELIEAIQRTNQLMRDPFVLRRRCEVARLLEGAELVEPGLVTVERWYPSALAPPELEGPPVPVYGGLGRKQHERGGV